MVKHVILWKLKDEHNNVSVKQGIKNGLEIKVEICGLASSNADVMLYSVFENENALKGYAVHPEHVFVADTFVRPFTQTRMCLDFEV